MGIEPTTCALQVRCSTTELPRPVQLATFLIRDYITACSIEQQAGSGYKHMHQRALLPVDSCTVFYAIFYQISPELIRHVFAGILASTAHMSNSMYKITK